MKKTLIFGLIFNLVLFFGVSVLGASFNPFEWEESIRKVLCRSLFYFQPYNPHRS